MVFFTPDSNITDTISVFPTNSNNELISNIKIIDISPFISNENLTIEIQLENLGGLQGYENITAFQNSAVLIEKNVEVKEFESKKIILDFDDITTGTIILSIRSDEVKELKIIIPEKKGITTYRFFIFPERLIPLLGLTIKKTEE